MEHFLDTLAGGLLSMLGAMVAIYIQSARTRKNRMDEILAEKKVAANADAYYYAKEIESRLPKNAYGALERIVDHEVWFFSNRLFLPGQFPNKWIAIRNGLYELNGWKSDTSKTDADREALAKKIRTIATQAIDEIYKDMGLERIVLEDLSEPAQGS